MIEFSQDGPIEEAKDAATIIVYRRVPQLEIFMVKRHSRSQFMANAMVFPGGRLEEQDQEFPSHGLTDIGANSAQGRLDENSQHKAFALMIAALRETFEEAGLLIVESGLEGNLDPKDLALKRDKLNAGELSFEEVIRGLKTRLRLDALTYVAHWVTPEIEKRRFDARFFAAQAPVGQMGSHDEKETTDSAWLSPQDALGRYAAKEIELAPPTLRILLEIEANEAWLNDPSRPIHMIQPQVMTQGETIHLLLPGDRDFQPPGPSENRISRVNDRWVSIGRGA